MLELVFYLMGLCMILGWWDMVTKVRIISGNTGGLLGCNIILTG